MMLALIVLFTSAFPISIYAKQSEIITDNLSFEIGIGKDNCEKIKITNFQTGEIEYLKTSYNDNGTRTFSVTSNKHNKIITIEENIENIIVKEDKQIIKIYSKGEEIVNDEVLGLDFNIRPLAFGSWSNPYITYGHKALWVGITAGVLAGIVAMIFNLPVGAGIVVGVVATVIADGFQDLWYRHNTQYRNDWDILIYEGRKITEIYSVSNYTGYLGSNAKYWKGSLEN